MFIIVVNTVVLALDSHPPINEELLKILDIFNIIFTAIFILEALFKIIGMGFKLYFRDKMNIFDFIIVIFSSAELSQEKGGGISALRAFRLFRVFKLAKNWVSLRRLLKSIAETISSIGNFSVLLFLFIYVFSLLGM